MRRAEKEINDRKEIEEILSRATVCRLALCAHEQPYLVPLSFGYRDGTLYFHSAHQGKKMEMLAANGNVCFEVDIDCALEKSDTACNWTTKYRSVVGYGFASLIENSREKKEALDVLMAHYSDGDYTYTEEALEEVALFKVAITSMTGKKSGY